MKAAKRYRKTGMPARISTGNKARYLSETVVKIHLIKNVGSLFYQSLKLLIEYV